MLKKIAKWTAYTLGAIVLFVTRTIVFMMEQVKTFLVAHKISSISRGGELHTLAVKAQMGKGALLHERILV